MPTSTKPVSVRRRRQSPLTSELKVFIDRAIVPILVKEYLAVTQLENKLATKPPRAAHSQPRAASRPKNVEP